MGIDAVALVPIAIVLAGVGLIGRLEWTRRMRRVLWGQRTLFQRVVLGAVAALASFLVMAGLGFVWLAAALEFHWFKPSREDVREFVGVGVPDDADDFDAWHDLPWMETDYWVTFRIPRAELQALLAASDFHSVRRRPPTTLESRLREMDESWGKVEIEQGLTNTSVELGESRIVVDLTDPALAIIYARTFHF